MEVKAIVLPSLDSSSAGHWQTMVPWYWGSSRSESTLQIYFGGGSNVQLVD